ncbi:chloroplastic,NAD(P)H-quinone oxidoreductase subunit J [Trichinella spiralis]|uniref:Chloroplastic,NAD(P)H-quinone oxidoreductase subunit J n=1 Tax=Trichinella spiralis TaxID=6334 RepID=A0ABR3KCR2_TRISP
MFKRAMWHFSLFSTQLVYSECVDLVGSFAFTVCSLWSLWSIHLTKIDCQKAQPDHCLIVHIKNNTARFIPSILRCYASAKFFILLKLAYIHSLKLFIKALQSTPQMTDERKFEVVSVRVGAIESIRCRNPPVRQAAQLAFGAAPPAPSIGVDQ